jgi:hypothetical protein
MSGARLTRLRPRVDALPKKKPRRSPFSYP